jgi:hypothetical protein
LLRSRLIVSDCLTPLPFLPFAAKRQRGKQLEPATNIEHQVSSIPVSSNQTTSINHCRSCQYKAVIKKFYGKNTNKGIKTNHQLASSIQYQSIQHPAPSTQYLYPASIIASVVGVNL